MTVFLDTNVVVASVSELHEHHERSFPILQRVQNKHDEGYVSAHSLLELYAVLTKLPGSMRHSPEQALLSIEENVVKYFTTVSLQGEDYPALVRRAGLGGLQGGTIFDALLLMAAEKVELDRIYTFNRKHFELFASDKQRRLLREP